jgi:CelD/BcsL family acetyltransferase involved in cellulose biosynthesis
MEVRAHVALDDNGTPLAGIAFCHLLDIAGERIVTLPFSDYCDPLVDDKSQWDRLADRLLAQQCPIFIRCLNNNLPPDDSIFTIVRRAKWHGLNLRPELASLLSGMRNKTRLGIMKARRDEVVVRIAEQGELRAFFDMHTRMRKYKYQLLAQPYRFFETIWRNFIEPEKGVLMLAVWRDEIIGGSFFLEWHDTLYYKFNASVPDYLAHRPNDLLLWEGIQYAKAKGLNYLDLGLSDWDQEGLVQYKRNFGTEEKTIVFLRHVPDRFPTLQEQKARELLSMLTRLFTDRSVPDQITTKAGELLYHYFA